ncbi:MAG: hypothetical protein ABSC63_20400 [Candidatus Binataceae bacterium]|jgi:hypothetical protein
MPNALIVTALLLGAFVLLAGVYGLLYSLGVLLERPPLKSAGYFFYLLHFLLMLTIVFATPLGPWWKLLIAASAIAYLAIPPLTWRHLRRIHRNEERLHDSKPARRAARTLAGMGRGA